MGVICGSTNKISELQEKLHFALIEFNTIKKEFNSEIYHTIYEIEYSYKNLNKNKKTSKFFKSPSKQERSTDFTIDINLNTENGILSPSHKSQGLHKTNDSRKSVNKFFTGEPESSNILF